MPVKLIEPPVTQRGRGSSVDQKMLDEFVQKVGEGWATDGETYPDAKKARTRANYWVRHIKSVRDEKLAVRVWDSAQRGSGRFVFALTVKK